MGTTARKTLGDNLTRLMEHSKSENGLLGSAPAVERATSAAGLKIGRSTVDRIKQATTPVNLDYVDVLATVFRLDPWQLLVPDLAPKRPPALRSITEAEDKLYAKLGELAKEIAGKIDHPN